MELQIPTAQNQFSKNAIGMVNIFAENTEEIA
jgi:hypothetical protein